MRAKSSAKRSGCTKHADANSSRSSKARDSAGKSLLRASFSFVSYNKRDNSCTAVGLGICQIQPRQTPDAKSGPVELQKRITDMRICPRLSPDVTASGLPGL